MSHRMLNAEAVCVAHGKPQPKITWYRLTKDESGNFQRRPVNGLNGG